MPSRSDSNIVVLSCSCLGVKANFLRAALHILRQLAASVFEGALLPNREEFENSVRDTLFNLKCLMRDLSGSTMDGDALNTESFGNHGNQRRFKADFLMHALCLTHGCKVPARRMEKTVLQALWLPCPQSFAAHFTHS